MKNLALVIFSAIIMLVPATLRGQNYLTQKDISYNASSQDEYSRERCKLDIYYPDAKGFKTIVWFHGGGLTGGEKEIPAELKEQGVGVVAVNYRLSPRVQAPAYIEDAAASIAWVFENISRYGGDPDRVYVSGHSAGAYLTLMVALDKSYLARYGVDADRIRAYYPISGQAATHYQIRTERGLSRDIPIVDKYAALANIRPDTPPIMLTSGQAELDMACRAAENLYLYEALKSVGNKNTTFHELSGFDHGTVVAPAILLILEDMKDR